jgi:hypothetical protein
MATNVIQTGPQATTASLSPSAQVIARGGNLGETIVSELHGRYYEQCYRRNLFSAYAAAQTLAAAGTAMTGLALWNGSTTVNLVLTKISLAVIVTSATMTGIGLGTGTAQSAAPTSQTAATKVGSLFLGGAAPQATAMNAGTFTVAPATQLLLAHNTAAINTVGIDQLVIDLEGSLIIPPQGYVALTALGAASAAAAVNASFIWEEVPV